MMRETFKFIYPVNKATRISEGNVYTMEHIANLEISGTGYVSNDNNLNEEEESHVEFNIAKILLNGKDISYLLPAIDDRPGIEKACRKELLAKMKNNRAGKGKTGGRVVSLGKSY